MQQQAAKFLLIWCITVIIPTPLMAMLHTERWKRDLVIRYAEEKKRAAVNLGEKREDAPLWTPLLQEGGEKEAKQLNRMKRGDVIVHAEQRERNTLMAACLHKALSKWTSLSADPQSIIVDFLRPAWSGSTIATMEGMVVHSEYVGNDRVYLRSLQDDRLNNSVVDIERRTVVDQDISDIKLRPSITECAWLEQSIFRSNKRGVTLDYDQTSDSKRRIAVDDRMGVIVFDTQGDPDHTLDLEMLYGAARCIVKKGISQVQLTDMILAARFASSGDYIAVGGLDGAITTFDQITCKPLETLYNHDSVTSLTCTPDGAILACLADGSLRRWDKELNNFPVPSFPLCSTAKKKVSVPADGMAVPAQGFMHDGPESEFRVQEAKASAREICGTNCVLCCGYCCCAPIRVCAVGVVCGSCGFIGCHRDRTICPSQEAKASVAGLCRNNLGNCYRAGLAIPECILASCKLSISCCRNASPWCAELCSRT